MPGRILSTIPASDDIATTNDVFEVGAMKATARTTAPPGWLLCDGREVSRTDYATLFAEIGTTWGPGDGSTTFELPFLCVSISTPVGKRTFGSGYSSGFVPAGPSGSDSHAATSGAPYHSHTAGDLGVPSHSHAASDGSGALVQNDHSGHDPSPGGLTSYHHHDLLVQTKAAYNASLDGWLSYDTGVTSDNYTGFVTTTGGVVGGALALGGSTAATSLALTGSGDASYAPTISMNYVIKT